MATLFDVESMNRVLTLEAETVSKWLSGEDDGVERNKGDPVKGSTWYLISETWFRKWRIYVGLQTTQGHAEDAIYYLPRIDNSDLLLSVSSPFIVSSDDSHFNTPVKSGLLRNVDFELLPAKAWTLLDAHYGHEGKPLKRFTCMSPSGTTAVEIEFIYVNLIFLPPVGPEAGQVPSTMYCSRYDTMKETKPRLISLLQERFGCENIQNEEVKVWKVRKDTRFDDVVERLQEYITGGLRIPGKVLDEDKRLKQSFSIIVETMSATGNWRLIADTEKAPPILFRDPSTVSSSSPIPVIDADPEPLPIPDSQPMSIPDLQPMSMPDPQPLSIPDPQPLSISDPQPLSIPDPQPQPISDPSIQTCPQCNRPITKKPYFCDCHQVRSMQVQYCGYRCRCAHDHTCIKPTLKQVEISTQKRPEQRQGRTGLKNTGNTCYFNAALQCLSHTRFLTDYFLSDTYKSEINRTNRLGTSGRLSEAYANTLRSLWLGSNSSIVPSALRDVINSKCAQFKGFGQHDAQELLSSVLYGLSEDLNRVQVRPYSEELKVPEDSTDEEKAQIYWSEFVNRTSNVIVDNMYGQYRSQITCPECGKVSIRFEPFLMLPVDIPNSTYDRPFDILFVPMGFFATPISYQVILEGTSTIADLKIEISQRSGKSRNTLIVALTYSLQFLEIVSESTTISSIAAKASNNHYFSVFEADFDPREELIAVDLVQGGDLGLSEHRPISYSRLISVPKNLTLEQLYFHIFSLLFPLFDLDPVSLKHWKHQTDPDALTFAEYREKEGSELFTRFFRLFPTIASSKCSSTGPYNLYAKNYLSGMFDKNLQKYASCVYCKKSCKGCLLPFSTDSIAVYTQDKATDQLLHLVITFKYMPELLSILNVRKNDILNEAIVKAYNKPVSLIECLDFTCKEKVLDELNAWFCKDCRENVRGGKKLSVHKVPKVLWIHLKLFKQGVFGAVKNSRKVMFSEELDLRDYVDATSSESPRFRLYALCNHMGGMGGGHYTAYAKNSGDWLYFDDESVHPTSLSSALDSTPYLLCYESID